MISCPTYLTSPHLTSPSQHTLPVLQEAEMKRQMAWECEKLRIGYEKVLNFYRSTLLQETFEVKAFLSDHTISSYRMNDDRSTAELMSAMERAERAMAENKPAYEWYCRLRPLCLRELTHPNTQMNRTDA